MNDLCISYDIPRTKKYIIENHLDKTFISNLEEILRVFAKSNWGIGYISGMSFITKMILELTKNNTIKTYIILKNIFEFQDIKDINIKNKYEIIFKEKLPLLYEHFKKNNVDDFHYFTYTWLKCLFTFNFDKKLGENFFKIFILKNDFNVYFYIILAIYKCYEQKLLSVNHNLKIIQIFNNDNLNKLDINII